MYYSNGLKKELDNNEQKKSANIHNECAINDEEQIKGLSKTLGDFYFNKIINTTKSVGFSKKQTIEMIKDILVKIEKNNFRY